VPQSRLDALRRFFSFTTVLTKLLPAGPKPFGSSQHLLEAARGKREAVETGRSSNAGQRLRLLRELGRREIVKRGSSGDIGRAGRGTLRERGVWVSVSDGRRPVWKGHSARRARVTNRDLEKFPGEYSDGPCHPSRSRRITNHTTLLGIGIRRLRTSRPCAARFRSVMKIVGAYRG